MGIRKSFYFRFLNYLKNSHGGLAQVILLHNAMPPLHLHCSQLLVCHCSPSSYISPLYGHRLPSALTISSPSSQVNRSQHRPGVPSPLNFNSILS